MRILFNRNIRIALFANEFVQAKGFGKWRQPKSMTELHEITNETQNQKIIPSFEIAASDVTKV